jgi:hypothetical protein
MRSIEPQVRNRAPGNLDVKVLVPNDIEIPDRRAGARRPE